MQSEPFDVPGGVYVPVVGLTTLTGPHTVGEFQVLVHDPARAGFGTRLKPSDDQDVFPGLLCFVLEHRSERAPSRVGYTPSEPTVLHHVADGEIFDGEGVRLVIADEPRRQFVQKVVSGVCHPLVNACHNFALPLAVSTALFLARQTTLRPTQPTKSLVKWTRVAYLLSSGEDGVVFQAQVDPSRPGFSYRELLRGLLFRFRKNGSEVFTCWGSRDRDGFGRPCHWSADDCLDLPEFGDLNKIIADNTGLRNLETLSMMFGFELRKGRFLPKEPAVGHLKINKSRLETLGVHLFEPVGFLRLFEARESCLDFVTSDVTFLCFPSFFLDGQRPVVKPPHASEMLGQENFLVGIRIEPVACGIEHNNMVILSYMLVNYFLSRPEGRGFRPNHL